GEATGFGLAHEVDAAGGADVRDVQAPLGAFEDSDVAGNHRVLGGGRHATQPEPQRDLALVHDAAGGDVAVFLVDDDHELEHRGVLERAAHEVTVHDRHAIVGDRDD